MSVVMTQNPAIQDALKAFDNGTRCGSYDENVVLVTLESIAGEAMEDRGNTAFVVAALVQAERHNDALLILAKEIVSRDSSKMANAVVLLAQALSEEAGKSSGERKFTPRRPASRTNNGTNRTDDQSSTPPPSRHAASNTPTGEVPRWTRPVNQPGHTDGPSEQPHRYPPSRPMPPVDDNPPQPAGVPSYTTTQYPPQPSNTFDQREPTSCGIPPQEPVQEPVRRAPEPVPTQEPLTERDLAEDLAGSDIPRERDRG